MQLGSLDSTLQVSRVLELVRTRVKKLQCQSLWREQVETGRKITAHARLGMRRPEPEQTAQREGRGSAGRGTTRMKKGKRLEMSQSKAWVIKETSHIQEEGRAPREDSIWSLVWNFPTEASASCHLHKPAAQGGRMREFPDKWVLQPWGCLGSPGRGRAQDRGSHEEQEEVLGLSHKTSVAEDLWKGVALASDVAVGFSRGPEGRHGTIYQADSCQCVKKMDEVQRAAMWRALFKI